MSSLTTANLSDSSRDGRDSAYSALRQLDSAVLGLIQERERSLELHRRFNIYVPVLVTGAPIVRVDSSPSGDLIVSEQLLSLLISRGTRDNERRAVWLVNDAALDTFARMAQETSLALAVNQ